jgi:hypothetical protein
MCPHSLSGNIYGVEVLELSNNPSNHRPIKLGLKLNDQINTDEVEKNENTHTNPTRIAWNKVTDKHIKYYQKELDEMLKHMPLPSVVYCQELNCDNETHKSEIDKWCSDLTDCCLSAGNACLPKCRMKSGSRPGWSEYVKPYKDNSVMCHNIWTSNGAPDNGDMFEAMQAAKRQYFYAARKVIRNQKQLRFQRMAQNAASDRSRKFWDEIRKVRKNKKSAPNIDGMTSYRDIAEVFRAKYEDLFTSVPSNDSSIKKVLDYINSNLGNSKLEDILVTEHEVEKAIDQLQAGKSDVNKGLLSNHIWYYPISGGMKVMGIWE